MEDAARGMYFEDFSVESVYYTDKRTITEADASSFTTLCGFFEPLFFDLEYVETETQYRRRIAPGAFTFSVAEGLTILTGILHRTGMAFLGAEIEVLKPVFVGDTIGVEIHVTEKREIRKPDRGIITFHHQVRNQEGVLVMEYKVKRMIRKKNHTVSLPC